MKKNIDMIGKQLKTANNESITIVGYRNSKDVDISFEDGTILKNIQCPRKNRNNIKNPNAPSVCGVGYIGQGNYKAYENYKATNAYYVWHNMMLRVYDETIQTKRPTYNDCTICEEWHNFQNFAKWYEENYYEVNDEKMHIDKDILIKRNKIYSSDTCMFVPETINSLFTNRVNERGNCLIGVCKKNDKYYAQINKYGKRNCLGYFNDEDNAFISYKRNKEKYIKEVAEYYKNHIPEKLYKAMYNYIVEEDD